jgi:hypothetical protein
VGRRVFGEATISVSPRDPKIARHNRRAKRKKGKVAALRDERRLCIRCGKHPALFWQRATEPQISSHERAVRRRPRADHEHHLCSECYRALRNAGGIARRRGSDQREGDRRVKAGTGPGGRERRTGKDRRKP